MENTIEIKYYEYAISSVSPPELEGVVWEKPNGACHDDFIMTLIDGFNPYSEPYWSPLYRHHSFDLLYWKSAAFIFKDEMSQKNGRNERGHIPVYLDDLQRLRDIIQEVRERHPL
jgi:hypothetical protein